MYLVAMAWLYVVVLMALAEGVSDNGSWLGAAITLVFYGLLPLGITLYLIGTPARRSARRRAQTTEPVASAAGLETGSENGSTAGDPDSSGHPPGKPVAPEREEA